MVDQLGCLAQRMKGDVGIRVPPCFFTGLGRPEVEDLVGPDGSQVSAVGGEGQHDLAGVPQPDGAEARHGPPRKRISQGINPGDFHDGDGRRRLGGCASGQRNRNPQYDKAGRRS